MNTTERDDLLEKLKKSQANDLKSYFADEKGKDAKDLLDASYKKAVIISTILEIIRAENFKRRSERGSFGGGGFRSGGSDDRRKRWGN